MFSIHSYPIDWVQTTTTSCGEWEKINRSHKSERNVAECVSILLAIFLFGSQCKSKPSARAWQVGSRTGTNSASSDAKPMLFAINPE